MPPSKFAEAVSTDPDLQIALGTAIQAVQRKLESPIDLLFVFVAGYDKDQVDTHLLHAKRLAKAKVTIGCTCQAVICGSIEYEEPPTVTLLAGTLPGTTLIPMHLKYEKPSDGGAFTGWADEMSNAWDKTTLIAFADPFSFPMDILLERMNTDRPTTGISGGMASAASSPSENRLLLDDELFDHGAVMIGVDAKTTTIVSQGCRPIGNPLVITSAERNRIMALGGKPAFKQLGELYKTLPTRDQKIVNAGLQLGLVVNEYQDKFEHGDFLIRNVVGVDSEDNSIVVADYVRPGQTIQFHIRDHESASVELQKLLEQHKEQSETTGSLLFSCNGRGTNMFPDANHDARLFQNVIGDVPAAGFFAAGEIGPVGGNNYLHGFTLSAILFR